MEEEGFFQVLQERRSIRKFKSSPIDKAIFNKILDMCNLSPSAGGLQSFEIYHVDNKDIKKQIVNAAMDQEFIAEAPLVLIFCANPSRSNKYGEKSEVFSIQDATITAAYAQLTASALGLSSVWVGAFNTKKISAILKLPANLIPVTILAIGYKDEEPQIKTTRGPTDIIHEVKQ